MNDLNTYRRALTNLATTLDGYHDLRSSIESELDEIRGRLEEGNSELYGAWLDARQANPIEDMGGDPDTAPGLPDYDELTSDIPCEDHVGAGFDCHISLDTDEVFTEVSEWVEENGGEALALRASEALDLALETPEGSPGFKPSDLRGDWLVTLTTRDALALVDQLRQARENEHAIVTGHRERSDDQAAAIRMLRADLNVASLALASARDQIVATDNAAADRADVVVEPIGKPSGVGAEHETFGILVPAVSIADLPTPEEQAARLDADEVRAAAD